MKRLLLSMMFMTLALLGMAQVKEAGDFQVGVFGGGSFPLGTYKSLPETKTGYLGGLFMDKYFTGNKFGLGLDARWISHGISKADSIFFANGFMETNYKNKAKFQHLAFTFGPTYKYEKGNFQLEAFVRGGMMLQRFPEYETNLHYRGGAVGMTTLPIKRTLNDSTNKANTWVGLAGLRFNYKLSSNWAVFAQADYMQSFGSKFGGKASQFMLEERMPAGTPIDENTAIKSFTDHFEEGFTPRQTPYKSVNVSAGIKYIFGKKIVEKYEAPKVVETVVPNKQPQSKSIQIVVKDKQTGIALSGVTVSVESDQYSNNEISNANGEISKINEAQAGTYRILGEKNGIKTEILTLSAADFAGNEAVIYREIYHDDPRFTLIGETVDCDKNQNLPNIATVLTNAANKSNLSQTSDSEGKFIYQLDQRSDYSIVANQAGRYSQTELVSTQGLDRSKTLYVTLKLGVCNLVAGGNWVLKNIHYDFDKSNIRQDAAVILDNVVSVMKQNPTLRIELSSHTDSRGNDAYNQRLSQQRANAAVAYLMSKGIERSRLVAKGYGESRLLNHCGNGVDCSEEQHQENRRTEIKVLNY
ncbi:OmpA family protein [Sphingobacterium sp. 1.A.4]|uniref:OmpA family protein n=1 Tax=Sphingobacterium sp. 1.A.4 TaxID=2044603 RepID=UPI000C0BF628|nr:OmpA family protein [Sphingobacterium sp. 1.A.4]